TSLRDYHSEHSSEIKAFEEWWDIIQEQEPELNKTAIKGVYMLNGDSLDCENTYYFSDQMLEDSLFIQIRTTTPENVYGIELSDEEDALDIIELIHLNDLDVIYFV
ncbi:hypothetical protein D7X33_42495, partial [Butyricicoccus sp. 1XD8-22]